MTPKFVGLALFAEGRTDHSFLRPLIRRLVVSELGAIGVQVDVSVLESTASSTSPRTENYPSLGRGDRVAAWAADVQGGFHLLFVHGDADGDADRARSERTQPGIDAALAMLGGSSRAGISIVPVRETEAWVLADPDAVARVMRVASIPEATLRWLKGQRPEARRNPKSDLDALVSELRPRRATRRKVTAAQLLEQLGETVSMDRLDSVSSFERLRADTRKALSDIGVKV